MGDVVSMKDFGKKKEEPVVETEEPKESTLDVEAIMKKNKENEERVKRERAQANKKVKKSHNL